jgi:hypothetical protein
VATGIGFVTLINLNILSMHMPSAVQ